jgi:hypothetical protein
MMGTAARPLPTLRNTRFTFYDFIFPCNSVDFVANTLVFLSHRPICILCVFAVIVDRLQVPSCWVRRWRSFTQPTRGY